MRDNQTEFLKAEFRAVPSIVPGDLPAMSDEECLLRLAQVVRSQDSSHLDEIAMLIGRLAVTIE
jgi:hypothetical protein